MVSRSRVLLLFLLAVAAPLRAQDIDPETLVAMPSTPGTVLRYGADSLQFGELRLPEGPGPFPVVVLIHGGCWVRGIGSPATTAPAASALAARGIATWNVEYRQIGDAGGGWPGTFQDWGASVDYLRTLAQRHPLDLSRVVVAGHSAGAYAAIWHASRARLPAASEVRGADPLPVRGVVVIDGPVDLASSIGRDAQICGQPVIAPLMGGTPAEQPARYEASLVQARLPLGVRQVLVSSSGVFPLSIAEQYQARAREHGETVEVVDLADAGHFSVLAPGHAAWGRVEQAIVGILAAPR